MARGAVTCPSCGAAVATSGLRAGKQAVCQECERAIPVPPETQPADGWYYARDKQKIGPVPLAELCRLAGAGHLMPTDLVLQERTTKWVAVHSVEGLVPVAVSAPTTKRTVSTADVPSGVPIAAVCRVGALATPAGSSGVPWWQRLKYTLGIGTSGVSVVVMLCYWLHLQNVQRERLQHERWQQERQQQQQLLPNRPGTQKGNQPLGAKVCPRCLGAGKLGLDPCADCSGRGWFPPAKE